MMRFSPPTEITPEPAPEIIMNYDASCLPEPIILPTPMPSPTPPQNEDESGWLVSIPPLEGEFTLLETGTMQESQSNTIFLEVDTILDDANLNACTDEPSDCSLRGAIRLAELDPKQQYVISIPNDTYPLSSTIIIRGDVVLVGEDYPNKTSANVIIARDSTITTSFMPFQVTFFYDIDNDNQATNSKLAIYNLSFVQHSTSVSSSVMQISNTLVEIYNSQFIDNLVGSGTISLVDSTVNSLTSSQVIIKNTIFRDNETRIGGIGGAIFLRANSQDSLTLLQCTTLDNNYAHWGGGVATYFDNGDGTITIQDSNIINNRSHTLGHGAAEQQGGQITFTNNYWSPIHNTNRGSVNSVSPSVIVNTSNPQNMLDFDCEVPPPPSPSNSDVCLAEIAPPQPNTTTYRFRLTPYEISTNIWALLTEGTDINILGTNGKWYYAEYNGQAGWIIAYGVTITDQGCTPPLASYNPVTGEVDYPNIVYDYELEFPEPPWYTANNWSTLSMEEKFNIWRTQGAIYLWDKSTISNRDYVCTDAPATRHNCTLLVYIVFYELFYRIYGPERPLMVSDILAVTYPLELTSANVFNADMAKQALGTYYFYQVRDYCNRRPDTCYEEALQMPIEHFVYRYTYDDGSEVISDGFLPPLNAWYHQALAIANWYFGTPTVDISLITGLENIFTEDDIKNLPRNRWRGAERLEQLLTPTDIGMNLEIITMARLTLSVPRPTFSNLISPDGPITWANFPYPGRLETNGGTDFWMAVMAPMPPQIESNVKICVLNQFFDDKGTPNVEDDDTWALDAFAIVIDNGNPGFGTTPPWADTNYSRSFGAYRSCLCSQTKVINGC